MSELQDKLDKAAKEAEIVLGQILDEIDGTINQMEKTINDLTKEIEEEKTPTDDVGDVQLTSPKCVICDDPATHQKLSRYVCEYHWELSNDHKRGRG